MPINEIDIESLPSGQIGITLEVQQVGPQGPTGPANTLSIGSVTSGVTPSATLTGSAPQQTLNLVLPKGDQGEAGADALWNFRGDFTASAYDDWHPGDVATYNGSLWYCTSSFYPSVIPETLWPDQYPSFWQLVAAKGDTGATGAMGATGDQGPQGPIGLTGPAGPMPSLNIADNSATSITLADADNNKIIHCTASSAVTITVPSTLAAGFSCMVIQAGAGQITFVQGSGATLNSFGNLFKTAGQHAPASLIKVGAGIYNLSGNLA